METRSVALDRRHLIGLLLLAAFLLAYVYICWATERNEVLAAQGTLDAVEAALRREPDSAELHFMRAKLLAVPPRFDMKSSVAELQRATELNPHEPAYWLERAYADQALRQRKDRDESLKRALAAAPTRPAVAWAAGNLLVASNELDRALPLFRELMEHDPGTREEIIALCWRVRPDADALIRDLTGKDSEANAAFLRLLIHLDQAPDAAKVYAHLLSLGGETQSASVTGYIQFLLQKKMFTEAVRAWDSALDAYSELQAYREGANRIINPRFERNFLNAPFDWQFSSPANVTLEMDSANTHEGNRSLVVTMNDSRETELGLWQYVSVEPSHTYDLHLFARTQNVTGADLPMVQVRDAGSGALLCSTTPLADLEQWKEVTAACATGPDTHVVRVALARNSGTLLRGILWLDDFALFPAQDKASATAMERP